MKKINSIFKAILFLVSAVSYAQDGNTGIYKTVEDFLNNKTTHSGKHTHIKLHETFKKDFIEVKCNDSTYKYLKKDVFGYIDKEGRVYRFYNADIYPVLNPTEKIILYKKTSGSGMKGSPIVVSYFFSKDAGSEIFYLTLKNIEKVFLNDKAFDEIIEINFKHDDELPEYDEIHKMYKLNRLFELSKTGKIN